MKKILFIGYAWVVLRGLESLPFLLDPPGYFSLIHESGKIIGHEHFPAHSVLLYLISPSFIGLCGAVLYFGILKDKRFVRAWMVPYLVLLISFEAYGAFKTGPGLYMSALWLFVFVVAFSALNVYHVYINSHVLERDYKKRGNADSLVLLLGAAPVASVFAFHFIIPYSYSCSLIEISSWFSELEGHRILACVALGVALLRVVHVYRRHGRAASWFVWVGIFFSFLAIQIRTVGHIAVDFSETQAPGNAIATVVDCDISSAYHQEVLVGLNDRLINFPLELVGEEEEPDIFIEGANLEQKVITGSYVIGCDGTIQEMQITCRGDEKIHDAVMDYMLNRRYKPVLLDGKPIAVRVPLTITID